ncbi:cyclin-i [Plakobranchus ocellatus]|uniref:Cyclin-i n=1 Tax=Plakobranchus ocellatus TaxID=259542 RepID=A0AAV4D4H2_9GAST|nr:cyclin-i [Plakobranchus ocellatus]
MLSSNLDKERQLWEPSPIKLPSNQGISEQQRDEAAAWLTHLAAQFQFLPETCGLAVLLMDRVLLLVKVQAKYLQCVAVTCLYIAAKSLEEDENIPPTPDFVRKSRCGCSFSEITRMEMVILSKLGWNIHLPSAVDFLHTIHAVLILHYPHLLSSQSNMSPSEHLSAVMRQMLRCLRWHGLLQFRPSTVALALTSLELEQITPGWLRLVLVLQRMTNVGSEQLMQCREEIAGFLGQQLGTMHANRSRKSSSSAPLSKKRKVEHSAPPPEDENIYDGIKRLYSEETVCVSGSFAAETPSLRTSCSLEMHQESEENVKSQTSLMVN